MAKKRRKSSESTVNTGNYDYKTTAVRDARTGKMRYSQSNGDAIARALLLHLAGKGTIEQVVRANKLVVKDGGNAGLYRMSVGVALRGLVRNGTPVRIGAVTVKTLKQPVALPKVEAKAAPKKVKKAKRKTAPRKRSTETQLLADGGAPL